MHAAEPNLSWYQVPAQIKHLLLRAAHSWEDTTTSEEFINQAVAAAADNLDVLVTAYRYFFYKNNYPMALEIANRVIARVRSSAQLPEDWGTLLPILEARLDEPEIRLFLNTCAASGLVLARLGQMGQAKQIAAMIAEIDTKNEFGANTILSILTRPSDWDEEADDGE